MKTVILNEGTIWESKLRGVPKILDKDGIPICFYCGKKMKYYIPTKGKFKGQIQKPPTGVEGGIFVCDCERYPRNMIISVG